MVIKIKDIPKDDRPRERLCNQGVEYLGNDELLAILLGTGTNDMSVKELSTSILKRIEKLQDLKLLTYEQLIQIKGVGKAKACQIIAAIELGNRLHKKNNHIKEIKIVSAKSIYEYYKELLHDKKQEHFYCVYLDTKNRIIKDKLLFIGTVNHSIVHPREVFKEAYLVSATSFICVHNHPSGSVLPSQMDIMLTNQLKDAGNKLGIPLVDHVIVGEEEYYSFTENGMV